MEKKCGGTYNYNENVKVYDGRLLLLLVSSCKYDGNKVKVGAHAFPSNCVLVTEAILDIYQIKSSTLMEFLLTLSGEASLYHGGLGWSPVDMEILCHYMLSDLISRFLCEVNDDSILQLTRL